jgi:peptidoglycan hydrolase-like protein with peptidoglycan-binding domain
MRTLAGTAALAGIAAGSLAGASSGFAAPAQRSATVSPSGSISVLAVNNLGLNTQRAMNWQCWLSTTGYNPGAIDGQLGSASWKAAQRKFNDLGHNAGAVDGSVGPNTIKALQRYLNKFGYRLAVDGVAGPGTRSAFWDFNTYGC